MSIPSHEKKVDSGLIPEKVAERPQEEEAPEATPFFISFVKYNEKECQVNGLEKGLAKKALVAFKDIGLALNVFDSFSNFKHQVSKLSFEHVVDGGEYKKIYKGVRDIPDVEIYEGKIEKKRGRLFFFILEKVFYLIAIRDSHYDTTKGRRFH